MTIHAWSGIGVRETLNARDLDTLAANRRLATRIERTKVLVIDEISMLPARSLTLVDTVCRHIRGVPSPFGGLQVVLVGDFFQLPPVVRRETQAAMLPLGDGEDPFGAEFAHASSAWRDLAPTVCYLSEQHRQSDKPFLDLLAAIRANACTGIHRERLAARQIARDRSPEDCTRLFTHNVAVDEINQQQLAKLGGKTHVFAMAAKGAEPFVQALKRGCLSPERLAAEKGRGGDVHQERPGRPLRQRHARPGRGFRSRRRPSCGCHARGEAHRRRALDLEDRRGRPRARQHHASAAPARLGDHRA